VPHAFAAASQRLLSSVPGLRLLGIHVDMRQSGDYLSSVSLEVPGRIVNHSLHDCSRRLNRIDQTGCFAEPDSSVLWVAGGKRLPAAWAFRSDTALKLSLAPMPAVSKGIAADTCIEAMPPGNLSSNVGNCRA
jgi:hypothetical protein